MPPARSQDPATPRLYRYVGTADILVHARGQPGGIPVASPADLDAWRAATAPRLAPADPLWATFVVDAAGLLLVADRHSEHVACAGGRPVRSAGEIAFTHSPISDWLVSAVTNQSTGYCPEPESWPAVAAALDRIRLPHPGDFTTSFIFRRCPACAQLNLVKEGDFTCAVCGADLPLTWNLDTPPRMVP
jgi:hypothetical protein